MENLCVWVNSSSAFVINFQSWMHDWAWKIKISYWSQSHSPKATNEKTHPIKKPLNSLQQMSALLFNPRRLLLFSRTRSNRRLTFFKKKTHMQASKFSADLLSNYLTLQLLFCSNIWKEDLHSITIWNNYNRWLQRSLVYECYVRPLYLLICSISPSSMHCCIVEHM